EHYATENFEPGWITIHRSADHVVEARLNQYWGSVLDACFSPDGRILAVAIALKRGHGQVTLWDWRAGERVGQITNQIDQHLPLAFAPDGRTLYYADGLPGIGRIKVEDGSERPRILPEILASRLS